jgi:hypothetical protein
MVDTEVVALISVILNFLQLMLTTFIGYHSARKLNNAKTRRRERDDLHQSVAYLTSKHEAVDARTMTLQQWMDTLLTHKNLPHSSSSDPSQ